MDLVVLKKTGNDIQCLAGRLSIDERDINDLVAVESISVPATAVSDKSAVAKRLG